MNFIEIPDRFGQIVLVDAAKIFIVTPIKIGTSCQNIDGCSLEFGPGSGFPNFITSLPKDLLLAKIKEALS